MLLLCLGAHALPALMRADTHRPPDNTVQVTDGWRAGLPGVEPAARAEKPTKNPQILQRPL